MYKNPLGRSLFIFAMSPIFNTIIMIVIVLNTFTLALDRYPLPPTMQTRVLSITNYVFITIFALELFFKVLVIDTKMFLKDRFNIFDGMVVIFSFVEIIIAQNSEGSGGSSIGALRAFRLFRLFKLFKVGDLRVLLESITTTLGSMGNYTVLLGLYMYITSLLGMQFFAGNLKFDEDGFVDLENGKSPRLNFDDFKTTFLTQFTCLIGDNWNEVMYNCMRATNRYLGFFYFVSIIAFGQIIMMNLFLAILLGNFDLSRSFLTKMKKFEEIKVLI